MDNSENSHAQLRSRRCFTSFVCDSDDMDFGELISAIDEDEELQLGQLYFALPLPCLNRPVPKEELAALALKASEALRKMKGGVSGRGPTRWCGIKGAEALEFAIKKDVNRYRRVAETIGSHGGDHPREFVRRRRGREGEGEGEVVGLNGSVLLRS